MFSNRKRRVLTRAAAFRTAPESAAVPRPNPPAPQPAAGRQRLCPRGIPTRSARLYPHKFRTHSALRCRIPAISGRTEKEC